MSRTSEDRVNVSIFQYFPFFLPLLFSNRFKEEFTIFLDFSCDLDNNYFQTPGLKICLLREFQNKPPLRLLAHQ